MKLLPTLRVIEMLCRSPNATLGLARDYLIRTLQSDKSRISEDERLIQQYRQETSIVREKIKNIKTRLVFAIEFIQCTSIVVELIHSPVKTIRNDCN